MPEAVVCPEVRVRYAETDRMGYAYYANFLVWFEVGRNEWMRAQGLPYSEVEAAGCILPVISASVTYMKPAFYDDLLSIRTWVPERGRARLRFAYEVVRGGDLLVTGATEHACTGADGRVRRLPPSLVRVVDGAASDGPSTGGGGRP